MFSVPVYCNKVTSILNNLIPATLFLKVKELHSCAQNVALARPNPIWDVFCRQLFGSQNSSCFQPLLDHQLHLPSNIAITIRSQLYSKGLTATHPTVATALYHAYHISHQERNSLLLLFFCLSYNLCPTPCIPALEYQTKVQRCPFALDAPRVRCLQALRTRKSSGTRRKKKEHEEKKEIGFVFLKLQVHSKKGWLSLPACCWGSPSRSGPFTPPLELAILASPPPPGAERPHSGRLSGRVYSIDYG